LLESTRHWLDSELATFLIVQIIDKSSIAFTSAELQQLQQDHMLLAQVLGDLAQLEHLLAGSPLPTAQNLSTAISRNDAQQIATNGKIDLSSFTSSDFNLARQILFQKLREVEA